MKYLFVLDVEPKYEQSREQTSDELLGVLLDCKDYCVKLSNYYNEDSEN